MIDLTLRIRKIDEATRDAILALVADLDTHVTESPAAL